MSTPTTRGINAVLHDKGGSQWDAMHADYAIAGTGLVDDGAKVLSALADFKAANPNGGVFVLRNQKIKHTVPIVLPAANPFLAGSHYEFDFTGTLFLPYLSTNDLAAIDVASATSQEGYCSVRGGMVNGANSTGTGTVGWRIRSQNTRLHQTCAVMCNGAGYDFQYTLAAPPIRCLLDGIIALANKKGVRVRPTAFLYPAYSAGTAYVAGNVVSSGGVNYRAKTSTTGNAPPNATFWDVYVITCSGLRITNTSWIEANDEEGYYMDGVGQWADHGSIIENNGNVDATKSEVYITNENNFSFRDTYFETNVGSARPIVKIEGGTVPVRRGLLSGCQFTGYVNTGAVAVEWGVVGATYNITVKENKFDGIKVGCNIGAFSKGHNVADNAWSDSYNPAGGTTTPVTDASSPNTGRVKLSDNWRSTDTFVGTHTATNLTATATLTALTGILGASDIGGSETLRVNGAIRAANALLLAASNVAPAANVPGMYRTTATGSQLKFRAGTDASSMQWLTNGDALCGFLTSAGFWIFGGTDPGGTDLVRVNGGITFSSATFARTKTALTNGAAAAAGTLTNAPAAGNPTKWVPIDDNGTTRYIPCW